MDLFGNLYQEVLAALKRRSPPDQLTQSVGQAAGRRDLDDYLIVRLTGVEPITSISTELSERSDAKFTVEMRIPTFCVGT